MQAPDDHREAVTGVRGGPSRDVPFLMVFGWLAFAVIALFRPEAFGEVWRWLGDLPTVAEVLPWILLLPWVLGIAIWESGVGEWQRILFVTLLALAWIAISAQPTRDGVRSGSGTRSAGVRHETRQ